MCVTNDRGYVPVFMITTYSFLIHDLSPNFNKSKTTSVTCRARTAYSSGASESIQWSSTFSFLCIFVDNMSSCPFSFCHYIVYPSSNSDFWLLFSCRSFPMNIPTFSIIFSAFSRGEGGGGVFYITTLARHNVTFSLTLFLVCKLFPVMNIDETLINLRKTIKINVTKTHIRHKSMLVIRPARPADLAFGFWCNM